MGRSFSKDLRFCGQLSQKIKVNTIAGEGRTWKRGSKSNPFLCNFLRQIQFLNFKIRTSQEACCLSYHFFQYKPNFTKFCTDAKSVSANSLTMTIIGILYKSAYFQIWTFILLKVCYLQNCIEIHKFIWYSRMKVLSSSLKTGQ